MPNKKLVDYFDLLSDMADHFNVVTKLTPDVYKFVKINSIVAKKNSNKIYKLVRTLQYDVTFSGMRDRMLAGLLSIYNKVFELLDTKENLGGGTMKNYFVVGIETGNDLRTKVFSFDMYMIQADTYKDLLESEEFNAIPNIDDKNIHSAIFNFGFQYEKDMEAIDTKHKVFHIKAFQEPSTSIKMYPLKIDNEDKTFDIKDPVCKEIIKQRLSETEQQIYYVGMDVNEIEFVEENSSKIEE